MQESSPQITRITLQVLGLCLLLGGSLWILQPFIPSILWAAIIVITTWPLYLAIRRRVWNRTSIAVTIMTIGLFLVVVIPCLLAIGSIISNTDKLIEWAKSMQGMKLPAAPAFLHRIPVVGDEIMNLWQEGTELTSGQIIRKLAPYTSVVLTWIATKAGSIAIILVQLLLTLIIAAILYANGESTAASVRAFARRLAGPQGEDVAILAGKAVRGVALGVVLTAVAQAIVSGIGLFAAGVHSAGLLTAIIFMLCLAQIGPTPILVPAIIWLYWKVGAFRGTILLVFTIATLPLDNVLRPILIRKGAHLPLFLIFAGVIGGLVALGIIGLFVGPVILAVAHILLKTWTISDPQPRVETSIQK